ncbi:MULTISPECIES: pyruvate dehydrogenase complex dihydrolipoamide acetyltransferase [unclassified Marivivens]|jgi:pyruvate dehydrogenase E2 component (dihydrolipoamide acetyltransferase)|uniref:pyruvate dehydrogenase complex dihydrolipoamide acetyltransferase n=1 Tax=unclassified Marivivens TaxID=2622455 RepID=UPI0007FB7DCC|nr:MULTISPECIES: pyruvate dehydrogenase complex dihydrolipoamide acetyltransferase [unclassified Marivivens]APO86915.1 pyruvate dehydrogenase complex dihydrolipoamide acetyltransferase [Marivivens sp. JLT3646]NVJ96299.1 pyruvate dehydrogenase complex dihydrolipoamide acetyltransferase [Marivivens sp.]OBR39643.1 pyruvate dehydrogenase complex dihydrolipoamide acetyltransferase [Donghicola sp. JL3646]
MATEILMPALSPTMEEGTLAKWLVKEGDEVKSGDIIAEIETDKATMEFEAVDEGIVGKIVIAEGTEGVKVNTLIAILVEEGEEVPAAGASAPAAAPAAAAPAAAAEPAAAAPAPAAPVKDGNRVFASPLARRIAEQKGLDLSAIAGSGPRGRIVKSDVEGATAAPKAAAPAAATEAPKAAAPAAAMAQGPSTDAVLKMYEGTDFEEVKLDGMRKTIAARLTEAKQSVPHFYLRRDIELDDLLAFRAQLNAKLGDRGVKLSVNDFIIKACALALQQIPEANAVWAGDRVLKFKNSDVAVAVAIEGGLFTPVLKNSDSKSLSALSAEMKDLAKRARDRKLAPHEYQGGSFAISNLGMFGIDNFDAIINPPHSGILAVGAGVKKPVVGADDQIKVATVMSVTLSVDHRVIDGALGAQLLEAIKANLENPIAMLA